MVREIEIEMGEVAGWRERDLVLGRLVFRVSPRLRLVVDFSFNTVLWGHLRQQYGH